MDGTSAVEVVASFDGAILDVRYLGTPARDYLLGSDERASFPLAELCWPLVRAGAGGYRLAFTAAMSGEVRQRERTRPLAALIASGEAERAHELGDGAYTCAIPFDAQFRVLIGASSFEVRAAFRPDPYPLQPHLDWVQLALTAASATSLCVFLLLYLVLPRGEPRRIGPVDPLTIARAHLLWQPAPSEGSNHREHRAHRDQISFGRDDRAPVQSAPIKSKPSVSSVPSVVASSEGPVGVLRHVDLASIFEGSALGDEAERALAGLGGSDTYGSGGAELVGRGGGGTGEGTIGLGNIGTIGYGRGVGSLRGHRVGEIVCTLGVASVTEGMDKEIIRRVVRSHLNEVRFCYEKALVKDPKLDGRLTPRFTIGSSGAVIDAQIQSSALADPAVATCVTDAIRRWEFPRPPSGGAVIVSYPFLFETTADPR